MTFYVNIMDLVGLGLAAILILLFLTLYISDLITVRPNRKKKGSNK